MLFVTLKLPHISLNLKNIYLHCLIKQGGVAFEK